MITATRHFQRSSRIHDLTTSSTIFIDDFKVLYTLFDEINAAHLGLYSLSGKASYRRISRLDVLMIVSLWNLTGISTAN